MSGFYVRGRYLERDTSTRGILQLDYGLLLRNTLLIYKEEVPDRIITPNCNAHNCVLFFTKRKQLDHPPFQISVVANGNRSDSLA